MRLISWNTNARSRRVAEQIEFLKSRNPDILSLQEVTPNSIPHFRDGLKEIGLEFVVDSFKLTKNPALYSGPRRRGVLVASRYPATSNRNQVLQVPWHEKVLAVTVEWSRRKKIDLFATYIPSGSSNGWVKAETLEGIFEALSGKLKRPRILCGDFNAPQEEYPSGEIVTWAQQIKPNGDAVVRKRFRNGEGKRWDAAERNVLEGLAPFDLPDIYRLLNGWTIQEYSWYPIRKIPVRGRRFDHVFASRSLGPRACHYLQEALDQGLSDHAPIEVDFSMEASSAGKSN